MDTRTTAEKLKAEADTEMRVKSEAARAFLAGKIDQWKSDHAAGMSPTEMVRSLASTLHHVLQTEKIPGIDSSSAPIGIIIGALELLDNVLPR
jgi:hypothetical protein